jgi:O-antigen ligase
MLTLANSATWQDDRERTGFSLVQSLFLLSALLAPLEIKLVANLTLYDVVTVIIGMLLLVSGSRSYKFPPEAMTMAAYVFLLFSLLSTFRATHPMEAVTQTMQFAFIFFVQFPVILNAVKSPSMLRASVVLYLIGTLILMLWAMMHQETSSMHNRIRTFHSDNPNPLGYATAYMSPFVLHFVFEKWRQRRLLKMLIALSLLYPMLWALTASGSRAATVATVLALMIFLSFRNGFEISLKIPLRIASASVVIGVLGYFVYHSGYFPTVLWERIDRTLAFEESLIDDRKRLAIAAWRAFIDSPFVGVGLDNFRYVSTHYHVPMVTEQAPHNLWLQFMAQIGLFGTLGFLVIILYWFLCLFRAQQVCLDPSRREFLWAFITSFTTIMALFMFVPMMIQRQYWLLYGLGLVAAFYTLNQPMRAFGAGNRPFVNK